MYSYICVCVSKMIWNNYLMLQINSMQSPTLLNVGVEMITKRTKVVVNIIVR